MCKYLVYSNNRKQKGVAAVDAAGDPQADMALAGVGMFFFAVDRGKCMSVFVLF